MTEHLSEIQQQWQLVHNAYHRGYNQGLREGLEQGPAHPAVQRSVANMFHGWDGAHNALQRSIDRFNAERGGDRHE